ncbi:ABC transporter ATP-binding protein [Micromonospora sp. NPDC050980]|uniref:ABC transporter ATP-binding protein n=1 Tax=Micromonospora sp. NPDC050980 TaxID=3155161 RepID=UPI0033F2CB80
MTTTIDQAARAKDDADPRSRYWSLLFRYMRLERPRLAILGVLLLAATALQVLTPQLVRHYVDRAVSGSAVHTLMWVAGAYLLVALMLQVVRLASAYVGESAAWSMTNAMRVDLTSHCMGLDIRFHREHTAGELVERVDGDVTALAKFLSSAFLLILGNLLLIVGIFVSLFLTDARIGAVLLLYALCALAALLAIRSIATGPWTMAREVSGKLLGFVSERVAGIEDIRGNRAEGHVLRQLDELNGDLTRWQRTARVRTSLIFIVMHGTYLLGYGGALVVGGYLYREGLASIGTVYMIIAYTSYIYTPLNELRSQIQELQRANAGVRRVNELFAARPSITDGPGLAMSTEAPSVAFDSVSFRYADHLPMSLQDVSFSLGSGQVLGIMGRTGSGKTTVARLVTRIYDPVSGAVRIDGQDLRQARADDLRGRIGMVTQDVQLFHGTLRDNLTLFDPEVVDERIIAAIEQLGLREWYARLPDGLDTVLASGSDDLSAGEAQLLGVCRVLLREPALVILDEASSRLDHVTEQFLNRALRALAVGRTTIVIAHRPTTVSLVDQVLVLEDGRVVEHGPRESLLADPDSHLSRLMLQVSQEDFA